MKFRATFIITLMVCFSCACGFMFGPGFFCKSKCSSDSDCKSDHQCMKLSFLCRSDKICVKAKITTTEPITTTPVTTTPTTTPKPPPQVECSQIPDTETSTYHCTKGNKSRSLCRVECKNGYCTEMGKTITVCTCNNGKCGWTGGIPTCKVTVKNCKHDFDCISELNQYCAPTPCGNMCQRRPPPKVCPFPGPTCKTSIECEPGQICQLDPIGCMRCTPRGQPLPPRRCIGVEQCSTDIQCGPAQVCRIQFDGCRRCQIDNLPIGICRGDNECGEGMECEENFVCRRDFDGCRRCSRENSFPPRRCNILGQCTTDSQCGSTQKCKTQFDGCKRCQRDNLRIEICREGHDCDEQMECEENSVCHLGIDGCRRCSKGPIFPKCTAKHQCTTAADCGPERACISMINGCNSCVLH